MSQDIGNSQTLSASRVTSVCGVDGELSKDLSGGAVNDVDVGWPNGVRRSRYIQSYSDCDD